ncbi:MAG: right-handed parallel beta-helix repeat-containing protein [Deltaproteobacteria bacterium]|nr:right-handed parallel beta-helix repeat-containing protein [Deltaproteobacteria bacterium]MBW2394079.1 right-handed parallel beta-helix repeat-containing protein [Deltaproteobacteria bacterium]
MPLRVAIFLLAASTLVLGGPTCAPAPPPVGPNTDFSSYAVLTLTPTPDLEDQLRLAAQTVQPGTVIELPAGTYSFLGGVTFETSHVVIRGQGIDVTILDFSGAQTPQGLLARGDHFVVQDFTVLDPPGDGIKTEFIDGPIYQRVKVEWTTGADPNNGAYGLYPAECSNVLIDEVTVIGAIDAGIYVGQSVNVIVRNSTAHHNVLGIEIENTVGADVYDNVAHDNTAGIVIFNLVGLKTPRQSRVFNNTVQNNNTPNFAAGGILSDMPGGTGMVVLANDDVEIFGNTLTGNETVNLAVLSYLVTSFGSPDPTFPPGYDPYAEGIYIHDNMMANGGTQTQGVLGGLIGFLFAAQGMPVPDIVIGGWANLAKISNPDLAVPLANQLPTNLKVCVQNNGNATFGNVNRFVAPTPNFDLAPHDCAQTPLPVISLPTPPPPPTTTGYTPAEIDALCNDGELEGINWDAFVVNCPELSDYRLFPNGDPRDAQPRGLAYELNTPLFSDYTVKHRMIFLPPGTAMTYQDPDMLGFPLGAVIAKHFSFRDPTASPPRETLIETRLLILRDDGWEGLPYVWDATESVATYTPQGATVNTNLLTTDDELLNLDYGVPSRTTCGSCHFGTSGDLPIGPTARNLNRLEKDGPRNQLDLWTNDGLLVGAPASSQAPVLPVWDDPSTGTVAERARAYLEENCAHCHNPAGRAGPTGLWLDFNRPTGVNTGICKQPVAAGPGKLGLTYDIVPGDPSSSIMVGRLADLRPAVKMPEIEKGLVHDDGVALITQWVSEMNLPPCP